MRKIIVYVILALIIITPATIYYVLNNISTTSTVSVEDKYYTIFYNDYKNKALRLYSRVYNELKYINESLPKIPPLYIIPYTINDSSLYNLISEYNRSRSIRYMSIWEFSKSMDLIHECTILQDKIIWEIPVENRSTYYLCMYFFDKVFSDRLGVGNHRSIYYALFLTSLSSLYNRVMDGVCVFDGYIDRDCLSSTDRLVLDIVKEFYYLYRVSHKYIGDCSITVDEIVSIRREYYSRIQNMYLNLLEKFRTYDQLFPLLLNDSIVYTFREDALLLDRLGKLISSIDSDLRYVEEILDNRYSMEFTMDTYGYKLLDAFDKITRALYDLWAPDYIGYIDYVVNLKYTYVLDRVERGDIDYVMDRARVLIENIENELVSVDYYLGKYGFRYKDLGVDIPSLSSVECYSCKYLEYLVLVPMVRAGEKIDSLYNDTLYSGEINWSLIKYYADRLVEKSTIFRRVANLFNEWISGKLAIPIENIFRRHREFIDHVYITVYELGKYYQPLVNDELTIDEIQYIVHVLSRLGEEIKYMEETLLKQYILLYHYLIELEIFIDEQINYINYLSIRTG